MNRFLLPLGIFIVLAIFLAVGLNRDPHEVPSPLVGKPAPAFSASATHLVVQKDSSGQEQATWVVDQFSPADMQGKVWLLNVWSTWCVSCREEHPMLVAAAKKGGLPPVVGLNYKEVRGDSSLADADKIPPEKVFQMTVGRVENWLSRYGNPYVLSALDIDGRIGIDYGVYGVPETYLIDKAGIIRYKVIGPIKEKELEERILPLVKELEKQ